MPDLLQRAMRAHATRPVTIFPCPSVDAYRTIPWHRYRWPARGIVPGDPEESIALMRNTYRPTPAQIADMAKRAQDLARYSSTYQNFNSEIWNHEDIVRKWEAAGPPPISKYKLTFGKHKGKRLEDVPDSYLVKYLIPRSRESGLLQLECPLIGEAIKDFQKRYPDIKGQAGREKTKALANRDVPQKKPMRKGRRKATSETERSANLSKTS